MLELLMLIAAYFMFSLIPLFVFYLLADGIGIFGIIFYRLFGSAILEFVIVVVNIQGLRRSLKTKGITKGFWETCKEIATNYYTTPNTQFLRGRSQISYLILIGVILGTMEVPFYFLSFQLVGVALATIVVQSISFLAVAIYNLLKKEETFDLLKLIYISTLIGAIITIALSRTADISFIFTAEGAVILILAIIASTLFTVGLKKDKAHSRNPLFNDFRIILLPDPIEAVTMVKLLQANMKNFSIHLFGMLALFPFCAIFSVLSPGTLLGTSSRAFFTNDLMFFTSVFRSWAIWGYILIGTIIPYILLTYSGSVWSRTKNGQYDMWMSVLKMLQPLLGLYIGFYIWQESIRLDYIFFTTFFIVSTIFMRYFQETSQTRTAFYFISTNHPFSSQQCFDFLLKFKDIETISFLTGDFDLLVEATIKSTDRIAFLYEAFKENPAFKLVKYSLAKLKKNQTEGNFSKKFSFLYPKKSAGNGKLG